VEVRARRLAISPCPALTAGRWSAIAGWNARKRILNISRRRNSKKLEKEKADKEKRAQAAHAATAKVAKDGENFFDIEEDAATDGEQ